MFGKKAQPKDEPQELSRGSVDIPLVSEAEIMCNKLEESNWNTNETCYNCGRYTGRYLLLCLSCIKK